MPLSSSRPIACIVIGHRPSDPGNVSNAAFCGGGVSEVEYNGQIARSLAGVVTAARVHLVRRDDDRGGYARLPGQINALGPDFIISLHFNGFTAAAAHGTETLYWHSSQRGHDLALHVQGEMLQALRLSDRGVRPRDFMDRGGWLLGKTRAPCVICEPGFGSNEGDWRALTERKDLLVMAYARAITSFSEKLAGEGLSSGEGSSEDVRPHASG